MITFFKNRFSCFIEYYFFAATAAFSDKKPYVNEGCQELYKKCVPIIVSRYCQQHVANNCNVDRLKVEFQVMFTHAQGFPQVLKT